MTTYTITGTVTEFDDNGTPVGHDETSLSFILPDDHSGTFDYRITTDNTEFDLAPNVRLITQDIYGILAQGIPRANGRLYDASGFGLDYSLGEIRFGNQTGYAFGIYDQINEKLFIYQLGGDPFPNLNSLADQIAFNNITTGGGNIAAGTGFGQTDGIDIRTLTNVTVTENDTIILEADIDMANSGVGDDTFLFSGSVVTIDGGPGTDTVTLRQPFENVTQLSQVEGGVSIGMRLPQFERLTATNVETFVFDDRTLTRAEIRQLAQDDPLDRTGDAEDNLLTGGSGNDRLIGLDGADTLQGADGADTLNGGAGNDTILGGATSDDLRDVIYAGAGNDTVDAGYGNDLVYGMDGDDLLSGSFGADDLLGQTGHDTLSGGALSDLLFGGDGADFLNGGFGFDRLNGGTGADVFFHLGVADHGSDWVQDYDHAAGDVLVFGQTATADQFQINLANTANAGASDSQEAFVIYRPTGQILWALVDGDTQSNVALRISGGPSFDLDIPI